LVEGYFDRSKVEMGLTIDSMQQQANQWVRTLSRSASRVLIAQITLCTVSILELSRISIRPYCLTISIYFITHFGITQVLFFYGIINNLG